MSNLVELPDEALVSLWDLTRGIARAVSPVMDVGTVGIDCVIARRLDMHPPLVGLQTDRYTRAAENESNHETSEAISIENVFRPEVDLRDEDRKVLREMLPKLPELRYPIDDSRRVEFVATFRELAGEEVNWEPVLVTEGYVFQQKQKQNKVRIKHQEVLCKAFDDGVLVMCDADHAPLNVLTFTAQCFIPRHAAMDYLNTLGLTATVEGKTLGRPEKGAQKSSEEGAPVEPEGVSSANTSLAQTPKDHSRKPQWTAARFQELEDAYTTAEAAVPAKGKRKNPTQVCAKIFGIGVRTVRKKREAWSVHPENPKRLSLLIAGK